jgi:hypothetical protein
MATSLTTLDAAIGVHDRVRVPDGRVGIVHGFFRGDVPSVLVRFGSGGCERVLALDVTKVHTTRRGAA